MDYDEYLALQIQSVSDAFSTPMVKELLEASERKSARISESLVKAFTAGYHAPAAMVEIERVIGSSCNETTNAPAADVKPNADDTLSELFNPVTVAELETMFPAAGQWKLWAEKASANGLKNARVKRAAFNPYKAAMWFLSRGEAGWDLARCRRTLVKNLPARSCDEAHRLTGLID